MAFLRGSSWDLPNLAIARAPDPIRAVGGAGLAIREARGGVAEEGLR
jgi:hypothetical protein